MDCPLELSARAVSVLAFNAAKNLFLLKKSSNEASISITSSITRLQSPCIHTEVECVNSRANTPQQHAHCFNSSEIRIVTCAQRKENDSL
jgi:hypothetical protein